MLIGTPGQLKKIENIQLSVNCKYFERVKSFKYLGVIVNENMTWSEHIENIRSKVTQRLGILKRIKHLLPMDIRIIYVNTMVLPIMEYACLVWGDKNNKVLMDSLQTLQIKAARLVLDVPPYSSGSEALKILHWQTAHQKINPKMHMDNNCVLVCFGFNNSTREILFNCFVEFNVVKYDRPLRIDGWTDGWMGGRTNRRREGRSER